MRSSQSFAVALTCCALGTLTYPAHAQQSWSDLSIARAGLPQVAAPRSQFKTIVDDEWAPQAMPSGSGEAAQPAKPRKPGRGARPAPIPDRTQADGETEPPVSAGLAVDGHMEVAGPVTVPDGIEPLAGDPRLPEDRTAMLGAPAGYDSLAFQIELDPVTDARPARLARFEPYAPVGHRAGSWVVFPMVETGVTATSNALSSASAKPDLIFDVRPTLLAVSDWQRHAAQFKVTALGSAYDHFPSENDRAYSFESRGRLDITRHANIEMLASHSLDQESRSSTFAPTDASKRTPYQTNKLVLAYNQKINELTVQVRGTATSTNFQNVTADDGSLIDNTGRDLISREGAVRTAWNFHPALAIFAETAFNSQTYRTTVSEGINRDSTGNRARLGLSFGTASQIWRGEVSAGYGRQNASDARLQNVDGLLLDANLAWRATHITSVLWNAHTDFVTSTLAGQGNATQHTGSMEVRHAFQRNLNGIASASVRQTDYQGVALAERMAAGELGLEYYLSRSTTLLGKYQHIVTSSTAPGSGTTADAVRLGVRYQP